MGSVEPPDDQNVVESEILIDWPYLDGHEIEAIVYRMIMYGADPLTIEGVLREVDVQAVPGRKAKIERAKSLLDLYKRSHAYVGVEMGKLRKTLLDRITARVREAMNGRVVSVDPGSSRSYYAIWEGGKLVETGYLDHRSPDYPEDIDLVVVETPEGWPVRKADGGMQVVNTAIRAGEWLGYYLAKGAVPLPVPAPAWRAFLFGVGNAGDALVRAYVDDAVPKEKMVYNNVHTRDAVGMYLAVQVAAKESLLF